MRDPVTVAHVDSVILDREATGERPAGVARDAGLIRAANGSARHRHGV
jgi:hypothetical protein